MAKYVYPAVFEPEDGMYNVKFPDLPHCFTCGSDLPEAFEMAEDALAIVLDDYEREHKPIPAPSQLGDISVPEGNIVNYVYCDTIVYKKRFSKRAVKKTLSIPEWLNEAATAAGINFSQVLQNALKQELHLL